MDKPKLLSPEWWQQKDVSHPWCDRFCREFFEQDPKLRDDPKTYESVGVIFANRKARRSLAQKQTGPITAKTSIWTMSRSRSATTAS